MKIILLLLALSIVTVCLLPLLRNSERLALSRETATNAPGQFVLLTNGHVHYQLLGPESGPVVVLIHGFGVPSYTWEKNQPYLANRGFRVLSFDLYGRGYSARPEVEYDRSLFVGEIAELLAALDITGRVHLVGLSMGGAVAAAFAADHPERVQSLVLLAPLNAPMPIGPLNMPAIGEFLAYSFVVPAMPVGQFEDFVRPERYPGWDDRFTDQMRYVGFRRAILATARGFVQSDPMKDFTKVGESGTSTLLLWGDTDVMFPLEQSGRVRSALGPNAEFQLIEEAGHALHYECAEAVNGRITEFLQAHSRTLRPRIGVIPAD